MELRSRVVVIVSREFVGQGLIERGDGHIDEEHVAEAIETPPQLIAAGREVLDRVIEDLAEELTERGDEPVVKGSVGERAADVLEVALAEGFE